MRQILHFWERPVSPGRAYEFHIAAPRAPQVLAGASWHTFALLEWLGAPGGEAIKSVLLDHSPQGWAGLHAPPPNATALRVALCHYAHLSAPPRFEAAFSCREVDAPKPQRARLAVAFQQVPHPTSFERNLQVLTDTVRAAGERGAGLLCMSECLLDRYVEAPLMEKAWALDDTRLKPLWRAVREANLWAVFAMLEKRGGRCYITAVLASPDGVAGTYSKRQLAANELEMGISPGEGLKTFETPWGKLGMLVCWDAWFPHGAGDLAEMGAEIICLPLAGDGTAPHWEHVWRARALDNQVFWLTSVTANCGGGAPSRIIAPSGEVLAQTREPNGLAFADVTLPWRETASWLSIGPSEVEVRNIYEHARRERPPSST